jgi:hypothetical protein
VAYEPLQHGSERWGAGREGESGAIDCSVRVIKNREEGVRCVRKVEVNPVAEVTVERSLRIS